jgi:hypothetical protein
VGQCNPGGKDFKRDYAKEQLKENMGQCKVFKKERERERERDFKE